MAPFINRVMPAGCSSHLISISSAYRIFPNNYRIFILGSRGKMEEEEKKIRKKKTFLWILNVWNLRLDGFWVKVSKYLSIANYLDSSTVPCLITRKTVNIRDKKLLHFHMLLSTKAGVRGEEESFYIGFKFRAGVLLVVKCVFFRFVILDTSAKAKHLQPH